MAPAFLPSDGGAARLLRAAMFSSGERGRGRTKWNSSPADSGRPESTRAHFSLHESGAVIAVAAAGKGCGRRFLGVCDRTGEGPRA